MKTTFDIPDDLIGDVQRLARSRGTTAKSLVEQALRALLDQERARPPFQLADGSVAGDGLSMEFERAGWDAVRDAAYGH